MATIPLMLMAIGELVYLLIAGPIDVRQDLREHGEIVAAAVAENSEYGLTSGNLDDLNRVVRSLVLADKWIYRIEVFDAQGRRRLSVGAVDGRSDGGGRFDARVFRRTLQVDDFGSDELPHFS